MKNPSTISIKNNEEGCATKTINLTTGSKNNGQQVEGNRKVTIHKKDERANNYDKEPKLHQEKEEQELKEQQHLRQQLKNNGRNEKETDTSHNHK